MDLCEATNSRLEKEFLDVPKLIYTGDKNWVCPLSVEISNIFDAGKNVFYSHGEAVRWVIKKENKLAGRIAAFVNYEKLNGKDHAAGGIGFFESIPDEKVAFALFNQSKKWLSVKGLEAMDGPINFGGNNNYWGLLVDGFTQPAFGMNYNPPYYHQYFENYGFKPLYEQYTNHFDLTIPLPVRYKKIVERVFSRINYRFEHIRMDQLPKYINDIVYVYNKAWVFLEDFRELRYKNVNQQFEQMKSIIDEKLIWFVYVDDTPAGFMIAIPDCNQIIKHFNGKFGLWEKLKFYYLRKIGTMDRVRVVAMGIIPEFQNRGLESGLIVKMFDMIKAMRRYCEGELSWVGSFNPEMIAIHKASGATFGKKHITYRKTFK